MTIKDQAIAIKQTRKDNLIYLKSKMQEAYKTFRRLKTLLKEQKDFSLSDAIELIENEETLEVIDDTNITEKLIELETPEVVE